MLILVLFRSGSAKQTLDLERYFHRDLPDDSGLTESPVGTPSVIQKADFFRQLEPNGNSCTRNSEF